MSILRRLTVAAMMAAMLASAAEAQPAGAPPATGSWYGALPIQAASLRLQVEIATAPDGGLKGTAASVDQSPRTTPLADIKAAEGALSFTAPAIQGRFTGRWNAAKAGWDGVWSQPGGAFPFLLKAGLAPPRLRPQTPKPPFPYLSEDVAFDSAPGVRLAGTLTLPPGKGPFPAAVLITGSGQQDRDETILGHKPFLVLADALTRRGIAVLRLDDRGAGGSTGDFGASTTADFAVDIAKAVVFLRTRPEIAPGRIGLIGHSEGGAIGPMVAAKDRKIAFVVMLAGPGVSGAETMKSQREALGRGAGATSAQLAAQEAMLARVWQVTAQSTTVADAAARIHAALPEIPPAQVNLAASQAVSPWWRFFLAYDPQPTLRTLRMPVLALNGSRDQQVVAALNLPAVRAALKDDRDATVVELPGLNHLFQTAATGSPDEYGDLAETFSPTALDLVSDWVVAHSKP